MRSATAICKTINRSHAHRTHRQRKHPRPRHRQTSHTNTERKTAQRRLIVEVVVADLKNGVVHFAAERRLARTINKGVNMRTTRQEQHHTQTTTRTNSPMNETPHPTPNNAQRWRDWPLQDIRLVRGLCTRINSIIRKKKLLFGHPTPPLHRPHYCAI